MGLPELILAASQAARLYLDLSVAAGLMTKEQADAHWTDVSARARQAEARWEQSKQK